MTMSKRKNSEMWEYLESVGVLENGTDMEIKSAKKAYRKIYLLKYKRKQRENKPEYTVNFSDRKGELSRVQTSAKRHKMTVTGFIRSAVLAYIAKRYIVPDTLQVAQLEQYLSDCLNEVQNISRLKEKYTWDRENKYTAIEKRIEKLEAEIHSLFRNPSEVINDCKNKIIQESSFQETS